MLALKSLKTKIILSFVLIVLIMGTCGIAVGVHIIGIGILTQAQQKVNTDLNSAREIYQTEVNYIKNVVRLTSERFYIKNSLLNNDLESLKVELTTVRENEHLDILTLTDASGKVLCRSRNPAVSGDDQSGCELIGKVMRNLTDYASTEVMPMEELVKESSELVARARMAIIPTSHARPSDEKELTSGMMIKAAAPVIGLDGKLLGILYGGNLINKNYRIVDKIKQTVFQNESYKGKEVGTATLFQGEVRVATNVLTRSGERATGTRIAAEVYERVLVKGEKWTERAFVVDRWYITAYEPILNSKGAIIGVLYVGTLEDKFMDLKWEAILILVLIMVLSVMVALVLAYFLSRSITRPLRNLAVAAKKLADGDINHEVDIESQDEIGELGHTFNLMIAAIKDRDEKLKAETQQQLIQLEKMSSLGQMAAGVAHEINNPLSGVLTYIQLMLKNIKAGKPITNEELERKLLVMDRETARCTRIIRSLLDFARQTKPSMRKIDMVKVIDNSLVMLQHQAELANVSLIRGFNEGSMMITGDPDQLQQVFTNIILNGIQAMPGGGKMTLSIKSDSTKGEVGVSFADTGQGILPENLKRLFTPFFTTKEKGQGIGLGLAVCYGIIERHGGTIKVDSQLGVGTTFTIWLKERHDAKGQDTNS